MNIFNPKVSLFSFLSSTNKIDKTVCIYRGVKIKNSEIGARTYIGNDTDVEASIIGKFCSIADHCRIGMGRHSLNHLSTSPIFTQRFNGCKEQWAFSDISSNICQSVIIGNDVWIGSHVLINGGVKIGDGAVIGAGAVVVKDVPPYAIVGGVPAKIIRYRFSEEIISKLLEIKWWNMSEEQLKNRIYYFQREDVSIELLSDLAK